MTRASSFSSTSEPRATLTSTARRGIAASAFASIRCWVSAVAGAASFSVGGVRLDLAGGDKGDNVLGAKATNVGGALLALAGGDVGVAAKGVKATNVGGAWMLNAGSTCDLSANTSLTINVGGAFLLTGAKVVLKVGGSSVTIAGGQVKFDSPKVEIIATGPHAEVAPVVADK